LYLEGDSKTIRAIEEFEKFNDKVIKYLSMKIKNLPKEDSELAKEKK